MAPGTAADGMRLTSLLIAVTQNNNKKKTHLESLILFRALRDTIVSWGQLIWHILEMSNYPMLSLCLTWRKGRVKRGLEKAKLFLMRSSGSLVDIKCGSDNI